MASEVSLQDVLAVEDDPSLLEFTCPDSGFLLWPLVRLQFLRCILSDLLYGTPLMSLSYRRNYRSSIPAIARAVLHNFKRRREAKGRVLLMATGAGHVFRDGRWFNRLSDHFALATAEDAVVVEDLFDWRWPHPRHNERVLYHTPLQVYSAFLGRMLERDSHREQARKLIAFVGSRAKRLLRWELGDQRAAFLITLLGRQAAAIAVRRRAYESLFRRTGAKVIIKEDGCFGQSAILNATARDMGVVIAEYQHGAVSAGHDAYNIAPAMAKSDAYRRALPEFFLGYGRWWNDQINVPVVKIAIGNPHRTEQLRLYDGRITNKVDILIIGDGYETNKYLDLAHRLAVGIDSDLRVVFRPHPMERARLSSAYLADHAKQVHIDPNDDIYESLYSAHAVVSEISTVLFEAVGIADRVFIWDTPKSRFGYPTHPFASFSDPDDLATQIKDGVTGYPSVENTENIWAPNWRANYFGFLEDKVGA